MTRPLQSILSHVHMFFNTIVNFAPEPNWIHITFEMREKSESLYKMFFSPSPTAFLIFPHAQYETNCTVTVCHWLTKYTVDIAARYGIHIYVSICIVMLFLHHAFWHSGFGWKTLTGRWANLRKSVYVVMFFLHPFTQLWQKYFG